MSENKAYSYVLPRLAGALGILGSVLSLALVLLATFLSPWFSWSVNALSELGISEQAWLFNSAVFIGGTLTFLFDLGLYRCLGRTRITKIGIGSVMVSNISLALVGIFTMNYIVWHAIVAASLFLFGPVGFLLIGYDTKSSITRRLSLGCGVAALFAILILPIVALVLNFKIGFAVPEYGESLVVSVWTVYMSIRLLKRPCDSDVF